MTECDSRTCDVSLVISYDVVNTGPVPVDYELVTTGPSAVDGLQVQGTLGDGEFTTTNDPLGFLLPGETEFLSDVFFIDVCADVPALAFNATADGRSVFSAGVVCAVTEQEMFSYFVSR